MPSLASAPCRPKSLPFICARAASIVPARSIFYRLVVNAHSLHEVTNELRNLICGGVEREMTSIEDVDIGFRHIFAVTFRFSEIEREIVLTPDHEQTWLTLLHPCLPFRIGVDVRLIIVEKIALNLGLAGLIQEVKLVGPQIRIITLHIRIVSDMARPRRLQRQKICAQRVFIGGAIFPKFPPRFPIRTQTFIVSDGIL